MKLPELEQPQNYTGLYVFDFGEQVAVGYTADEIAVLLESEQYQQGKAYRIHRALPDGTMELQGMSRERFLAEEGVFFYRSDLDAAQRDFAELTELAASTPPPCRVKLHLARLERSASGDLYATALIYPAEHTHDLSKWLSQADYQGGDRVEGGISLVTDYYAAKMQLLDQQQLWPAVSDSRTAEQVLATTHLPIQRRLAC